MSKDNRAIVAEIGPQAYAWSVQMSDWENTNGLYTSEAILCGALDEVLGQVSGVEQRVLAGNLDYESDEACLLAEYGIGRAKVAAEIGPKRWLTPDVNIREWQFPIHQNSRPFIALEKYRRLGTRAMLDYSLMPTFACVDVVPLSDISVRFLDSSKHFRVPFYVAHDTK
jgi:hypothetical protein